MKNGSQVKGSEKIRKNIELNLEKKGTEKILGSEAVVKSLIAEGVDLVFGYPGGAIMPVYDALYNYQDKIKHVLVRHEQGAVHAAQGYARATGKVGVCIASAIPVTKFVAPGPDVAIHTPTFPVALAYPCAA